MITNKIDDERLKFLPARFFLDHDVIKDHLIHGKWSLLHFSAKREGLGTEAFRIVPWLRSNEWPVGGSMNYFESGFNYRSVYDFLVRGEINLILNKRESIEERKNKIDLFERAQRPFFEIFECEDGWGELKGWINNETNWPKSGLLSEEKQRREKELFIQFDNSVESKLFIDLIEHLSNDSFLPEPPSINLEMYEERVFSAISYRAGMKVFDYPMEKLEDLIIHSVKYAHGFGTEDDDLRYKVSMMDTCDRVFDAVEALFSPHMIGEVSNKIKQMSEFHIAQAMNKQKRAYNGIAHVEVAALMDDQLNDPKQAWKYLQAASYWVGKNMPEAQGTVLDAAMHLCDKHGWKEALEVLEYNKAIMES